MSFGFINVGLKNYIIPKGVLTSKKVNKNHSIGKIVGVFSASLVTSAVIYVILSTF